MSNVCYFFLGSPGDGRLGDTNLGQPWVNAWAKADLEDAARLAGRKITKVVKPNNSSDGRYWVQTDGQCYAGGASTPVSTPTPTPAPVNTSTKFSAGQRVTVSSGPLNVRSGAGTGAASLGTQSTGAVGTITSGGVSLNGYYWWNVNYDSGVDGWSAEDYIINFNSQPPSTAGATWTQCAREGEQCSFSGRREVRYGVDGKGFITKVAENSVSCNDGPFGAPTTNYENFCFYSSLTTTGSITVGTGPSTPTPTPAPTPSPTPTPAPSPTPAPAPSGSAGPRVSSFTNSGPINAQSGQVISGMKISNPNGACITVNGVSNVIIRDSQIGPCGQEAVSVGNGSRNITIEYNSINDVYHGIRNRYSYSVNTNNNIIRNVRQSGEDYRHAIEYSWMEGGTVDGNDMKGTFPSDVISMFESNNIRLTNNQFDVQILYFQVIG
jgi:hypothetical protein